MPALDPDILERVLEKHLSDAPNDAVRDRLLKLHDTCKELVLTEGVIPTVPAVVAAYVARFRSTTGETIGESTIRNKMGGANLYHKLHRAWADYAKGKVRPRGRAGELVSFDELGSIPDPNLRHRVALTVADNHSLRSRVNILETVDGRQSIRIEASATSTPIPAQVAAVGQPNRADLDEVREFLDPRRLKENGLTVTADRALVTRSGHVVAEPGFLDALQRMVSDRR